MRLFTRVLFLTLVGSGFSVFAAPNAELPKPGLRTNDASSPPNSANPTEKIESIGLGEPEGPPQDLVQSHRRLNEPRRRTDWAWQAHVGLLNGQILENDKFEQTSYVGAMAVWHHNEETAWDFAVDIASSHLIRIGTARRTYFVTDTQFAPYWKVGLTQSIETNKFVSAFVDLERVKAIAAIGLGDLFEKDRTWTFEFGLGLGMKGVATNFQLGYQRSF